MARTFIAKPYGAARNTYTAPCDVILKDFIAFTHAKYVQPEKQMQTTY